MNEWHGKLKYSGVNRPSAALATIDSTFLDPGSNTDRRAAKPAINSLSYGSVYVLGDTQPSVENEYPRQK
jgi:hypothetical protein